MEGFSSELELRIDWSEIDVLGHVNNLAILKYIQAARVHYLEEIGLMQSHSEDGIGPILASTACQFRKPLFYPGKVTVRSRVEEIKNTSFRIVYGVYNEQGEIAAEARDIIVLYHFVESAKMLIPEKLRTRIQQLEKTCGPAPHAQARTWERRPTADPGRRA